jgi:monooxygenase
MAQRGYRQCTPLAPPPSVAAQPLIDLTSGYVLRSIQSLPRQGSVAPWRLHQNYLRDVRLMRRGPLEDRGIRFSRADPATNGQQPAGGQPDRSADAGRPAR